jgi:hypothetical protein
VNYKAKVIAESSKVKADRGKRRGTEDRRRILVGQVRIPALRIKDVRVNPPIFGVG